MELKFLTPQRAVADLMAELKCKSLTEVHKKMQSAGMNAKRELFFGSAFVSAVGKIQEHECLLKLADEPWDIEMMDKTLLDRGKKPNHWNIQCVQIKDYYVKDQLRQTDNIYKIFSSFLESKKLAPERGDYKGGLLVFHIGLNIGGLFDIQKLRKHIRSISQNKFEQIWITGFYQPDYSQVQIAELLLSDDQLYLTPFP